MLCKSPMMCFLDTGEIVHILDYLPSGHFGGHGLFFGRIFSSGCAICPQHTASLFWFWEYPQAHIIISRFSFVGSSVDSLSDHTLWQVYYNLWLHVGSQPLSLGSGLSCLVLYTLGTMPTIYLAPIVLDNRWCEWHIYCAFRLGCTERHK